MTNLNKIIWPFISKLIISIFTAVMSGMKSRKIGELKAENERLRVQNELLKEMSDVDASDIPIDDQRRML